jgi:multiple sugar transport system substrate-binding protein
VKGTKRSTKRRLTGLLGSALALSGMVVAAQPANALSRSGSTTLTVAFCSTYCFDTVPLTNKWWNGLAKDFEATHSGVTVKLVPLPGSYNDVVTKLSLLYRSGSTAPDVAEMPTGQIGLWASSGYLAPLNSYLAKASWWAGFPKVVQSEGTFGGKVYAVDQGENDSAMVYNKVMFKKAGIAVPWHPKTGADIIAAAKKIKAALPNVTPLWLNAGTGSGANGLLQGINNFLVGTNTPEIFDAKTSKWVVDSPGIRESLEFYKTVYADHLGASISQLFSPNAVTTPLSLFSSGKLAMALGSNYFFGNWTKLVSAPYWGAAPATMAATPVPTLDGNGADVTSTLGGWDYAVGAHAPDPSLAFQFISLMESQQNSINAANWAGWVTPNKAYWNAPAYTKFASYNNLFAQILPNSTLTPTGADYSVWAEGMGRATGQVAQDPGTSIDSAVNALKSYVTQQLGSSMVETLK